MSNNITNLETPNLPYYVATYQGRSVAIKRDADYQNTIKLVQKSIAKLRGADAQDIVISTALADYDGALVQISEEIWPDVVGDVRTVEISLDDPTDGGHPASGRVDGGEEDVVPVQTVVTDAAPITEHTRSRATSPQTVQDSTNTSVDPSDTFSIKVRTSSQGLLNLGDLRSSSTIGGVKSLIEMAYNVPAVLQRLELLGQSLDNTKALGQYDITDWTILDLHLNARQSMIYFFPDPTLRTPERFRHKDIEVTLSLNRAWELATLRPSREVQPKDYVRSMSWIVDVALGALWDHGSNTELICLFWDGISRPAHSITPDLPLSQSHPEPHPHSRSNLVPLLDPTNSAALPFSEVEAFVQMLFYYYMGFTHYSPLPTHFASHVKQKTHEYIALRFVPQADCESISSLSISLPTDRIARVLVLYKGLSALAARTWDISPPKYTQGIVPWKGIVGIEPKNYWGNPNLAGLKVLEIAWMEVC